MSRIITVTDDGIATRGARKRALFHLQKLPLRAADARVE
jgi:hypothetical protein